MHSNTHTHIFHQGSNVKHSALKYLHSSFSFTLSFCSCFASLAFTQLPLSTMLQTRRFFFFLQRSSYLVKSFCINDLNNEVSSSAQLVLNLFQTSKMLNSDRRVKPNDQKTTEPDDTCFIHHAGQRCCIRSLFPERYQKTVSTSSLVNPEDSVGERSVSQRFVQSCT